MRNKNLIYITGFFGNFFFERGIWILYLLSINFTMFQVGILQAALNLSMFLMEVPSGIISDKFGRKKALLIGHSMIVVYLCIFLLSSDFYILLLGHVIFGAGLTFISGTDQAYLYDSLKTEGKEKAYGKAIGTYNAIVITALAIAIGIGGFMQELSWSYVFIGGIIAQSLAIFLLLFLKEINFKAIDASKGEGILSELSNFFKLNTNFKFLVISFSVFFSVTSVFYMFGQEMLNNSGMLVRDIAILFAGLSILQAILSIFSYKFSEKYTAKKVLILTFSIIGALYIFIAFNNLLLTIISFVIINALYELVDPISSKVINDEIPSRMRATILSLVNLVTSLLMFILFPLMGYAADIVDSTVILSVLGVLSVITSIVTIIVFYRMKPNKVSTSNSIA
ncbi:MFS transporter [Bacillus sp. FJAT-45037]|uniref:MFS transporter n=1 Tax=Bacillus sp. FJAT-45037 TaxID=2011007 RepID=UPI000C24DDE4|nr:MFS transporter [Bacillus sp. FJAT-45037]